MNNPAQLSNFGNIGNQSNPNNNNYVNTMIQNINKKPFQVVKTDGPMMQQQSQQQQGNIPTNNGKRTYDQMNNNQLFSEHVQQQQQQMLQQQHQQQLQGQLMQQQFNNTNENNQLMNMNLNMPPQQRNKTPINTKDYLGSNEKNAEQEKKVQTLLKEYESSNFRYSSEGFTFQANQFLKRIASEAHATKIAAKYPLFKMLRSIAKKFIFNELEIVFFAYILRENNWKIDDDKIKECAPRVKDFLNNNELHDQFEYLQLLLYLILNAYAVKYYLNDMVDMEMYEAHIQTIVPEFSMIFPYWSKKFATTSLKINPKILNKVFYSLSAKCTDSNKKIHEDYNQLVDNIIQISPPYNNSDKSQDLPVTKRDQGNNGTGTGISSNNNANNQNGMNNTKSGNNNNNSNPQSSQPMTYLNSLYLKKVEQQQKYEQQQQQQMQQNAPAINSSKNIIDANGNNANIFNSSNLHNGTNGLVGNSNSLLSINNPMDSSSLNMMMNIPGGQANNNPNNMLFQQKSTSSNPSNTPTQQQQQLQQQFSFRQQTPIQNGNSNNSTVQQQLNQNQQSQQQQQSQQNSTYPFSSTVAADFLSSRFESQSQQLGKSAYEGFPLLDSHFDSSKQLEASLFDNQHLFMSLNNAGKQSLNPASNNLDKLMDAATVGNSQGTVASMQGFNRLNSNLLTSNQSLFGIDKSYMANLGSASLNNNPNQFSVSASQFNNTASSQFSASLLNRPDFQTQITKSNNNSNLIVPIPNNNINKDFSSIHKLEEDSTIKALGLTETIKKFDPTNLSFQNHEN